GRPEDLRQEPGRADLLRRQPDGPASARLQHLPARARALRPRPAADHAARRDREDDRAVGRAARLRRPRHRLAGQEGRPRDLRRGGDPGSWHAGGCVRRADGHLVRDRQRRGRARPRHDHERASRPRPEARIVTIVPAEGAILDRILSATFEIWHEGLARAAYPRYYTGQLATAWGRANLRRWALVDRGEVLASVKTYAFDAVLDGRDIRAIGYGAVFTQPAHRGAGYARTLLDEMLQRAAADGCDAALLFSEIGAPYYERLGFAAIPTFDVTLRVREDARRGAPATLVRFGDDRDLADVASMGETRGAPFRFRLRRTRELVQYALTKRRLLAGLSAPGERAVQFF